MKKWLINYGQHVGNSHLPNNIPCQDSALCKSANGVNVAVLSDGCGSSALSEHGAQLITTTLCDLFISKFDELHCESNASEERVLKSRKVIIDAIGKAYNTFIKNNTALFEAAKINHKEKYEKFAMRPAYDFACDCLNATALFVAEKNDQYIIGQIGDGIIGGLFDNHTKILMEEEKDEAANQTYYPIIIYNFAKQDSNWYKTPKFNLKFPEFVTYDVDGEQKKSKFDGFFLMSDGVDGLLDKTVPFQKHFTKATGAFLKQLLDNKNFEKSQKDLNEEFLPLLVKYSVAEDDCSLAFLLKEDSVVDTTVNIVKVYPKPQAGEDDFEDVFDASEEVDEVIEIFKPSEETLALMNDAKEKAKVKRPLVAAKVTDKNIIKFREELADLLNVSIEQLDSEVLPSIFYMPPVKIVKKNYEDLIDVVSKVKELGGKEYKARKKDNLVLLKDLDTIYIEFLDADTIIWSF